MVALFVSAYRRRVRAGGDTPKPFMGCGVLEAIRQNPLGVAGCWKNPSMIIQE